MKIVVRTLLHTIFNIDFSKLRKSDRSPAFRIRVKRGVQRELFCFDYGSKFI
jgi:hypothetical protein